MNFLNYDLAARADLRDCTLITKNGTKIAVAIDSIESSVDDLPKFEGRIMGVKTTEPKVSYKDYYQKDVELQINLYKTILNSTYGTKAFKTNYIPEIKNVIFNPPATIVFWQDGTKTVVKATNEVYDPEKGLAMAIAKRALGNQGNYYNIIKKWVGTTKSCDSCKYCDACCTEDPCWDCDDHFCNWVDKNNTED